MRKDLAFCLFPSVFKSGNIVCLPFSVFLGYLAHTFFFKVVLFTNTTNAGPSGLNRFKFTLYIGYDEQSQEEKHTLKKKRF